MSVANISRARKVFFLPQRADFHPSWKGQLPERKNYSFCYLHPFIRIKIIISLSKSVSSTIGIHTSVRKVFAPTRKADFHLSWNRPDAEKLNYKFSLLRPLLWLNSFSFPSKSMSSIDAIHTSESGKSVLLSEKLIFIFLERNQLPRSKVIGLAFPPIHLNDFLLDYHPKKYPQWFTSILLWGKSKTLREKLIFIFLEMDPLPKSKITG